MKRFVRWSSCVAAAVAAARPAAADEWSSAGPRAGGMGGAGVAVADDAMAAWWNPAGLARRSGLDFDLEAGWQAADPQGVLKTLHDVEDLDFNDVSAANLAELTRLVNELNRPKASLTSSANAGLFVKWGFEQHAFALSLVDAATAGEFVSTPLSVTNSGTALTVNGELSLRGLETRQLGFSYAASLFDGGLLVGATGKVIQARAYLGRATVTDAGDVEIFENLKDPETSTALGVDAGLLLRPTSWLSLAVAGRDLTSPSFDAPSGGDFELTPKARGGVALHPLDSLTITGDVDLTNNETLVPGIRSRYVAVGLEQSLLADVVTLRAGAYKDLEREGAQVVPTAGVGLRLFFLRVDVAGGYDFDEEGALASFALSLTF